ncbi:hypothetical protein [Anthocerotibacter panamensis]|nr:hypothetical protein [Anthocerotibacter panamensis]
MTEAQAQKLKVKSSTQLSPWLEPCCVRLSANVSYANAQRDLQALTGSRA